LQATAREDEEIDPLQYRPNPEALVSKLDSRQQASEGDGSLVYKPPKLNPVSMEEDPDKDYHKRERRAATNLARKSGRNQLVRDLAREVADAPDEVLYSPCFFCGRDRLNEPLVLPRSLIKRNNPTDHIS
jgi:hypothetical protein